LGDAIIRVTTFIAVDTRFGVLPKDDIYFPFHRIDVADPEYTGI
jgi:hypothetical protein